MGKLLTLAGNAFAKRGVYEVWHFLASYLTLMLTAIDLSRLIAMASTFDFL